MAKYLLDPIKSFEEIKQNYILYIKTAFGTRYTEDKNGSKSFETEREELLNKDHVLSREPWIEPIPFYKKKIKNGQDVTIMECDQDDLPNMDPQIIERYKSFIHTGLMSYPMYEHQYNMLHQSLLGRDCVITSGTGSGKTESFLLPLFADIFNEAASWPHVQYQVNDWWNIARLPQRLITRDDQGRVIYDNSFLQRAGEQRPAAIRALVVYPMNALVEDQMARLRKALDSDEIQQFFDEQMDGNRVFFGRYNSQTPVAGEFSFDDGALDNKSKRMRSRLKEILRDLDRQTAHIEEWVNQAGTAEERELRDDQKYTFQRTRGRNGRVSAEMRSRFDMQETPPDILITNYSMLAIMLMRTAEQSMIEKTKQWLAEDPDRDSDHPTRIFHLVIDELHLNRGTSGTEIAYLLRQLIYRLGLEPNSKQLKILASSASLEAEDVNSLNYLKDFFNRPFTRDNIIEGPRIESGESYDNKKKLPLEPFVKIKHLYRSDPSCFERMKAGETNHTVEESVSAIATELSNFAGIVVPEGTAIKQLLTVFASQKLAVTQRVYDLFDIPGYGKNRAIPLFPHEQDNNVLGRYFVDLFEETDDDQKKRDAAEGFVIVRGLYDLFGNEIKGTMNVPRLRFHFFFKNIGGLWASIDDCKWSENRPVGKLHDSLQLVDDDNNKILELLYCETCGSVFYGGRRHVNDLQQLSILPNSPNIEDLPEKSSQVIVDKQRYSEYAIFWPVESVDGLDEINIDEEDQPIAHRTTFPSKNSRNNPTVHCEWQEAKICKKTGEVVVRRNSENDFDRLSPEDYVTGYLYWADMGESDSDLAKQSPALPCRCPSCGVNHINSTTKVSPLRGFRTGFSKTTQIFAKELFYQLPTKNPPKLVTFSDSREDAATVANGIEREQFNDLVRDVFIKLTDRKNEIGQLQNEEKELMNCIQSINNLAIHTILQQNLQETQRKIRECTLFPILSLVNTTGTGKDFIESKWNKEFSGMGINPAGCNWENQTIRVGGSFKNWYEITADDNTAANALKDNAKDAVVENIAFLLFGRLHYGLESAGIGIATTNRNTTTIQRIMQENGLTGQLTVNQFQEIVDSTIRLLGEHYRYRPNPYNNGANNVQNYRHFSRRQTAKKFVNQCWAKVVNHPLDDEEERTNPLGEAVFAYLTECGHSHMWIECTSLYVKIIDDNALVYRCPKCGKIHLHPSFGICSSCLAELERTSLSVSELQRKNYTLLNKVLGRKVSRLHSEELTGQTDNQAERQRYFKNFIIGETPQQEENLRRVMPIDVLSVTTTMEVGVDIGSLQAVMLANMPPQRFNYQQRVGRGGRRGQAYSMILTLCRGRSHDEHYYHNPHQITGDQPPTPSLAMDRTEIAQRLFNKEVLYHAFKELELTHGRFEGSTHGEFGLKSGWDDVREEVREWLANNNNKPLIEEIVKVLKTDCCEELYLWASTQLYDALDRAAKNPDITSTDLAETLAESGILPMYGMPTRNRDLYHGFQLENTQTAQLSSELSSVSRDIEMAITSFAPGAQITKDKRVVSPIGFAPSPLSVENRGNYTISSATNRIFSLERTMQRCPNRSCSYFSTRNIDLVHCPECGEKLETINLRTPNAFITDLTPGENRMVDSDISVRRKGVIAEKNDNNPLTKSSANYSLELAKDDFTWRINDTPFEGKEYTASYHTNWGIDVFGNNVHQWILRDNAVNRAGTRYTPVDANAQCEEIQLAAQKVTNVIKLMPRQGRDGIKLNPFDFIEVNDTIHFEPKSQGVRAAYYSLSFILQRAIASKLDVDPREIDVVEPVRVENLGQIVLSDEQVNGSGFVNDLYQYFDDYINRILNGKDYFFERMLSIEHGEECKSSCYQCLSNFTNMPYHGLLDWRLGIALLRVMTDKEYKVGLDGNFNFPELRDWKKTANDLLKTLHDTFWPESDFVPAEGDCNLPYLILSRGDQDENRKYIFAIHPLWTSDETNRLLSQSIVDLGLEEYMDNIFTIDTFNLLRRPGACFSYLDKLINGNN